MDAVFISEDFAVTSVFFCECSNIVESLEGPEHISHFLGLLSCAGAKKKNVLWLSLTKHVFPVSQLYSANTDTFTQ